jgi:hypothetical protein
MKIIGKSDKMLFIVIVLLIAVFGVSKGLEVAYSSGIMGALLTGFISFALTGVIMTLLNALFGIWVGKAGGAFLFAFNCLWISTIIF